MSNRGRGTLEVKRSNNPFYQSANSEYGNVHAADKVWDAPILSSAIDDVINNTSSVKAKEDNGNFAFLYTRTSDAIGSRVPKAESSKQFGMTEKDFRNMRNEIKKKIIAEAIAANPSLTIREKKEDLESKKTNVEELLRTFKQGTKVEDPRLF